MSSTWYILIVTMLYFPHCKWFFILVSHASFWVVDVKRVGIMQHTPKEYLHAFTIWYIYTQLQGDKNLFIIWAF